MIPKKMYVKNKDEKEMMKEDKIETLLEVIEELKKKKSNLNYIVLRHFDSAPYELDPIRLSDEDIYYLCKEFNLDLLYFPDSKFSTARFAFTYKDTIIPIARKYLHKLIENFVQNIKEIERLLGRKILEGDKW